MPLERRLVCRRQSEIVAGRVDKSILARTWISKKVLSAMTAMVKSFTIMDPESVLSRTARIPCAKGAVKTLTIFAFVSVVKTSFVRAVSSVSFLPWMVAIPNVGNCKGEASRFVLSVIMCFVEQVTVSGMEMTILTRSA